jgi:hypothetical protein
MPNVSSSAINRIEWTSGTLSIWFIETGRYDYFDVPKHVYEGFFGRCFKRAVLQ